MCALSAASAQGADVTLGDTLSLREVTVTAIKQVEDTLEAGAVTVIDRRTGERNGVMSVKTAAPLVPNLFVPDYGSRMTSAIYIRGIGARMDQPATGLNIDNVPIMCKENYDLDILDIDRVEVLRGPQSTMFGRNTMGGVINVYTLSPLNYQGTRILLEGGSHTTLRAGVSHYRKLSSTLALGASASMNSTAGEFVNEYNGKRCDWERQGNARVKLDWQPLEGLYVSNVLSACVTRQGGYPYERVETGMIAYNDTCFYRRTSVIDGITVKKDFDTWSLAGIASYQYLDDNMTLDQDFTPIPYFTLTQARSEHAATLDVVARNKKSGKWEWTNGATGFYRHINMRAPVTFLDQGIAELIEKHRNEALPDYPITWDERKFVLGSQFTAPTWGVALYHRSTLDLGKLRLAAGLRVDYEHAALNYRSTTHTGYVILHNGEFFAHEPIDIDDKGNLGKHYFQFLPSFNATWRFNERNSAYATISRGSKAGGYNTQMFSDVLQQRLMNKMGFGSAYDVNKVVGYKPEKAWNFEVGTNLATADRKLRADFDLFYVQCRDLQLTVFPEGTTTGRLMTNAGKSRSLGAEAAIAWQPREATGVNLSYGYTNSKFLEYNNGKADFKGKYIPFAPAHTLHASAYNRFAIACGDWLNSITLSANVQAAGRIYWDEANTLSQPFYALLGGELTLEGRYYTLEVWGRNLTGTRYHTFYFVSMSRDFLQRGRGRSLCATLRLRF